MTNHEWYLQKHRFTNMNFHNMKIGKIIYETRVYDVESRNINIGDQIKLLDEEHYLDEPFSFVVVDMKTFGNFRNALGHFGIRKFLPYVKTLDSGVKLYENYPYKEETYKDGAVTFGVVVFKVVVNNTPKIHTINMENPTERLMFDYIKNETKTVIGKNYNETYRSYVAGDKIKFVCEDEEITSLITNIKMYENVEHYLRTETLRNTLPHIKTIKNGVDIYKDMVSFEELDELMDEYYYGFLGIRIKVISE
jgi:ASC-1-like (ASCH) protein